MEVLFRLLRSELGFPEDPPRIFIYDTNWDIPPQEWMFVVIAVLAGRRFAGSLRYDTQVPGLDEYQTVSRQTRFTVDVFSVNSEALDRLDDIYFALRGTAAEQVQEKYGFKIGRPTDFVDLSALEASRRLKRYQCEFSVLRTSSRKRSVGYFDKFTIPPEIIVNP